MSHCTIHGSELRCLNCGDFYEMALPASLVMTIAMSKTFDAEHKKCKPSPAGKARFEFSTPQAWMKSWDTGESSKTLWHQMMCDSYGSYHRPATPQDPSDFGRCYRLLKAFPGWRDRIEEMRPIKGWASYVDAWPELERLYEEELPSGTCPKLFAAMKACRGER